MLPPGASMAVIEGSFSKPGPFTVRLKFPANYRIPPHWHPIKVTVTVISGTFNMGFGDELDTGKGKSLPAASIFEMPAKIHHFGWTTEETIIQEHGIGPLSVHYLDHGHTGDGRTRP
ncbi:MAG: cupin [Candidatus Rokuibacteriota bacterium]|nr:MAG: cupin [Candidatus Rokubacteria bacterium]